MSHRLLIAGAALLLSLATACGQDDDGPNLVDASSNDGDTTEEVPLEDPIGPGDLGGTAWTIQFIDGNPVDGVGVTFTSLSREQGLLALGHTDDCGEGVVELRSRGDLAYEVSSVSYSSPDGCAPTGSLGTTFSLGEEVFIQIDGGDQLAVSTSENEILGRHFESVSVNNG